MSDFYAMYWEQQPLHIQRETGDVGHYIDLAAIEALLSSQPVYFPGIQLTHSGHTIDVASYADEQNRILPLRLFEHYGKGATVVLSQAQKLFAPLNNLCREVMRTMKMRCQTNVYLSPPAHQGFNAHYDTHDVFIIQVSGAKTFNFYPSNVSLPCPEERFDPQTLAAMDVDESIHLTAGDTLYIPRGVVHDALADDSEPSIHITLGVYPVLARDMLQEAIQIMSEGDSRLRQSRQSISLPAENTDTGEEIQGDRLRQALGSLLQNVQTWLDDAESIRRIQSRFDDELALGALQDCQGLSSRASAAHSHEGKIPDIQAIHLRRDRLIDHEYCSGRLKIRTFGQILEFSEPIAHYIEKLLSTGELSGGELSGLQVEQRDAAIKPLLQANLVDLISET